MITLLVIALSVEVRGNAGKGICSYIVLQFSLLLYRILSKEIREESIPTTWACCIYCTSRLTSAKDKRKLMVRQYLSYNNSYW